MYIYLDESGDLGFDFNKRKTTNKFVITLLVCHSQLCQKEFQKAVRRTLKNKLNKGKERTITELKGAKTSLKIKEYFFRNLKRDDWGIYTVILNKSRVKVELRTKKDKLYNFIARFIIERLPLRAVLTNVRLIVDRSKNKEEIRDFNRYVQSYIQGTLPLNTNFKVEHLTSQESAGLQATDIFCWGIARKFEHDDMDWYRVFKHKIKYETEYLREGA